jgi:hypothetical protein
MSEAEKPLSITRRSFAVGAAVAATATMLPGRAASQTSSSDSDAMNRLSPGARAEVQSKVNEIFRKYGSRLSDEQKADIRKVMAETQEGLEKMRSFALTNGDQPATVLEIYRESGHTSNA